MVIFDKEEWEPGFEVRYSKNGTLIQVIDVNDDEVVCQYEEGKSDISDVLNIIERLLADEFYEITYDETHK